ncbi:unnamed protein product [Adineta ricciae]|uniref:Uncharacterized protein n=1 Tax=Adineta ricciae TaxID=249248 RepID=A0A815V1G5_ADIRI|nr:unnamed protein product [Adineta ricciae]CAF1527234.1 unnamed protein product [Adineta ricciae]
MLLYLLSLTVTFCALTNAQSGISYNQGRASYMDAGQLHMISGSVTNQSKQDVLYSHLLIQLAANAKAPRSAISSWYQVYERTLSTLAWIVSSSAKFTPFTPSTDRVSLKSVITTSLANRINPELQNILSRSFERFQQMKADDPVIVEFTKDSSDGNTYNIQVQIVDEKAGDLSVLQLYVTLTTSESIGNDIFLLHEFAKNAANIQIAYESITLNSDLYATIRQSVINKLGPERIARYISRVFDDGSMIF